jgi:glutaredoxin
MTGNRHLSAMSDTHAKQAIVYRMVMPEHICPYGVKSLDLLRRAGFSVDDRWLRTRAEVDAFKEQHRVKTTPQTFIDGRRIGGYTDLRRLFDKPLRDANALNYRPVIAVFAVALLMSLAANAARGTLRPTEVVEWFIAFSMCLLAMLKLQDVENFSTMFLNYDLLARRFVPYSYAYPYGELLAGLLMLANVLVWIAAPLALFIGGIGAISVFKAVYLDKRELKCACVGGNSNVPLGFVSLTENVMMIAMAIWMLMHR